LKDISEIKGIGAKTLENLKASGITNIEELVAADAEDLASKLPGVGVAKAQQWIDEANAEFEPAKKVEEKPKEAKKEEKPKEEKAKKEAKPKEEKKVVKKKEGTFGNKVKNFLDKWGYRDVPDYLILVAGIYGLVWAIITAITAAVNSITGGFVLIGNMVAIIFTITVYVAITFFPKTASFIYDKIRMKKTTYTLSPINTKDDARALMVFIALWTTLVFWILGGVATLWIDLICFVLIIVATLLKARD